jgi:hypothetical protein
MRLWNTRVYAAVAVAYGLFAINANADPITTNLFYTTTAGPPNNVNRAVVTLSQDCQFTVCTGQLAISGNTPLASLDGADGIVFAPDGNLLIGGQSVGFGGGTDPARVHEISPTTGAFIGDGILPPGNGAYHLALGPASDNTFRLALRVLCNSPTGDCGAHYSRFLPLETPIGQLAESVDVFGPPGADLRITGMAFDPANNTWYYGATPDGSIAGEFGTITFGEGAGEIKIPFPNVPFPALGLLFDPSSDDIIMNSGETIAQFDPRTNTIVSSITRTGEQFDGAAVDGKGHLFVASHTGFLLGVDYSNDEGHLINGPGATNAMAPLAPLEAKLSGIALEPTVVTAPEPASLALLGTALLALGLFHRRPARAVRSE